MKDAACQSDACLCEKCGGYQDAKLDNGLQCAGDNWCSSDFCQGFTAGVCNGQCTGQYAEGEICQNNGNCESGQCTCGRCADSEGRHVDGLRCPSDSKCQSGWCRGAWPCIDHNTGGTCDTDR